MNYYRNKSFILKNKSIFSLLTNSVATLSRVVFKKEWLEKVNIPVKKEDKFKLEKGLLIKNLTKINKTFRKYVANKMFNLKT